MPAGWPMVQVWASSIVVINIPYNDTFLPAQVVPMPVPGGPGTIVITAASLKYLLSSGAISGNEAFMPSAVIGATYG